MEVRMAEHLGMCFGVRDAIDLALGLARQGPVTILGDLVHNPDVVAEMAARGCALVTTMTVLKSWLTFTTTTSISRFTDSKAQIAETLQTAMASARLAHQARRESTFSGTISVTSTPRWAAEMSAAIMASSGTKYGVVRINRF